MDRALVWVHLEPIRNTQSLAPKLVMSSKLSMRLQPRLLDVTGFGPRDWCVHLQEKRDPTGIVDTSGTSRGYRRGFQRAWQDGPTALPNLTSFFRGTTLEGQSARLTKLVSPPKPEKSRVQGNRVSGARSQDQSGVLKGLVRSTNAYS